MKKRKIIASLMGLMSLMGLVVLMAACSQGDPVVPGGNETEQGANAIAFSADLPEQQEITRSTPLEIYYENFKVWGFKNMTETAGDYGGLQTVMDTYHVKWSANTAATTTSNSHDWEYVGQGSNQTIKYWDWSAKAYRFFAVTNYKKDKDDPLLGHTIYKEAFNSDDYQFSMLADASDETEIEATPYYSRLWFSTNEQPTYADKQYGQPVTLEFIKPYSKVRFLFIYSYPPEGIKLKEKEFKPSDGTSKIARKGTFTVIYPLKGSDTRETFSVAPNSDPDPDVSKVLDAFTEDYMEEGTKKWYTVLPAVSQGSYTLSVKINNTPRTAVVPANYMTWLPGYSYTYVFKITEQGGVEIEMVLAAVIKWDEGYKNDDYTVYNW